MKKVTDRSYFTLWIFFCILCSPALSSDKSKEDQSYQIESNHSDDEQFDVYTYLEWDEEAVQPDFSGYYARIKKLSDGRLALVYERALRAKVRFSSDLGKTWFDEIDVSGKDGYSYANPEIIELENGWLVYGANGRPTNQTSTNLLPYTISVNISIDRGVTWSNDILVYTCGTTFSTGCWEPSFLQLPNGELQIYFADESEYLNSNEQQISMLSSPNHGLTWLNKKAISYSQGSRDGMPVPLLLNNSQEIVVAIEDNGINGQFKPTTVRTSLENNWNQGPVLKGDPLRELAVSSNLLPYETYAGAPYIVQLSGGETLLSIQSNIGRKTTNRNIQVYIGDEEARNFSRPSTPFPSLGDDEELLWNGLGVLDDSTVISIASPGLRTSVGHVKRVRLEWQKGGCQEHFEPGYFIKQLYSQTIESCAKACEDEGCSMFQIGREDDVSGRQGWCNLYAKQCTNNYDPTWDTYTPLEL
ncbi:sialidase family protein [Microbulbifer sp. SSSA002]|uniref:sialidase family protein n=1 Tax=Microbulbifer sp. SSSA002 TaxID=3243376 RepID=UPI004039258C